MSIVIASQLVSGISSIILTAYERLPYTVFKRNFRAFSGLVLTSNHFSDSGLQYVFGFGFVVVGLFTTLVYS